MADHVRVGVVGDDEVVRPAPDRLDEGVGHAVGRHGRLEVVGRDLRAGDEAAILARPGHLDAAIEEVRDVGVLLRLRDVELAPAGLAHRLGQRTGGLGREGHVDGQTGFVGGHRDDVQVDRRRPFTGCPAVEAGEGRTLGERPGQLPSPVGPEVGVDDDVAVDQRRADAVDGRRDDELVGLAAGVGGLDGLGRRRRSMLPFPMDDRVVSALDALPALITIHREVPAADRRDGGRLVDVGQARFQVGDVAEGGRGRRVASVKQGVDRDARHLPTGGQLDERDQLSVVGMDPARPDEADDVERAAGRSSLTAGFDERRALEERSIGDRGIDARQVLEDGTSRPEVEVPDLGVAHLPGRETDRGLRREERAVRPARQEAAPRRHRSGGDGVRSRVTADPEPVQDDQDDGARPGHPARPRARAVIAARATMPLISSGLSEAPPTRAPSMAGSARNSPMLADVTLPP